MSKNTKIWLIVAASLILVGSIIFGGVMTVLKWDFTKLSTAKYETNEHTVSEEFKSIRIDTKTAEVELVASESDGVRVVCSEEEKAKHRVTVSGDTLMVELESTKKWYDHIGINLGSPKITVYLPQGEYGSLFVKTVTGSVDIPNEFSFDGIDISGSTGKVACKASSAGDVKVKLTTGKIHVEGVKADTLDLTTSTGNITVTDVALEGEVKTKVSTGTTYITNVTCKDLTSDGSTGGLTLTNVIAYGSFTIERDTGGVKLDGCDAAEIYVETDTGDVSGSLLTSKVFITETDTGKVDVPKSAEGGRCEISTDTGDIEIEIQT